MNAKQMAAISYIKRGWVVHPLIAPESKAASPGKRPILRKWSQRKIDSEVKMDWFENGNNIGLVCGAASGLTVIDFDNEEHFKYLITDLGIKTLQHRHCNTRRHVVFKYCDKVRNCKIRKLDIEILNNGANAVLPPSVHYTGEIYGWIDHRAELEEIPKEFIDRLERLAGDHPIRSE